MWACLLYACALIVAVGLKQTEKERYLDHHRAESALTRESQNLSERLHYRVRNYSNSCID